MAAKVAMNLKCGSHGCQNKATCFPYMDAMATMALMEAVAAMINLRIFRMNNLQNDNELFKGWI